MLQLCIVHTYNFYCSEKLDVEDLRNLWLIVDFRGKEYFAHLIVQVWLNTQVRNSAITH